MSRTAKTLIGAGIVIILAVVVAIAVQQRSASVAEETLAALEERLPDGVTFSYEELSTGLFSTGAVLTDVVYERADSRESFGMIFTTARRLEAPEIRVMPAMVASGAEMLESGRGRIEMDAPVMTRHRSSREAGAADEAGDSPGGEPEMEARFAEIVLDDVAFATVAGLMAGESLGLAERLDFGEIGFEEMRLGGADIEAPTRIESGLWRQNAPLDIRRLEIVGLELSAPEGGPSLAEGSGIESLHLTDADFSPLLEVGNLFALANLDTLRTLLSFGELAIEGVDIATAAPEEGGEPDAAGHLELASFIWEQGGDPVLDRLSVEGVDVAMTRVEQYYGPATRAFSLEDLVVTDVDLFAYARLAQAAFEQSMAGGSADAGGVSDEMVDAYLDMMRGWGRMEANGMEFRLEGDGIEFALGFESLGGGNLSQSKTGPIRTEGFLEGATVTLGGENLEAHEDAEVALAVMEYLGWEPETAADLLAIDYVTEYAPEPGRLTVEQFEMSVPGVAGLAAQGELTGLAPRWLLMPTLAAADMAEIEALALSGLALDIADEGRLTELVDLIAAGIIDETRIVGPGISDRESFEAAMAEAAERRAALAAEIRSLVEGGFVQGERAAGMVETLASFVEQPGDLSVEADPEEPVDLARLMRAAQSGEGPEALIGLMDLTIELAR